MKRLLNRGHIDLLALPPGASSQIDYPKKNLLIQPCVEVIEQYWGKGSVFIFIGAIGAVVRLISPYINSKEKDPAVLVMDCKGKNIVPILGGHFAGAEELAFNLSEDLGGNPVLTGFSSVHEMLALDSFGHAWGWKRNSAKDQWKQIMIEQAKGQKISFLQNAGSGLWTESNNAKQLIDLKKSIKKKENPSFCIGSKSFENCSWHPPVLWVGIGCERNTTINLVYQALNETFEISQLAKEAIAGIATIDLKRNEPALIELIQKESIPIKFFTSDDLAKIKVPNPSIEVKKAVGTSSVSEAAALLSAGEGATLKVEKRTFHSTQNDYGAVTISIAQSVRSFAPNRGELHLVGSGPGDLSLLTQDARFALSKSAVWIGYERYLDLLEPLRRNDQVRVNGLLTHERDRCQEALQLAQEGIKVALVSSGDIGIYGMAGLALEFWLKLLPNERPSFNVHPGISAFQFAAAKTGAPLMHDFCAISLSDCLTPWEKIEARISAAASADFVIALYNPKSKDRYWQLKRALQLLLDHRSPTTPVILARQIGREEENISFHKLESFPEDQVDMLSLVLIGNSMSFVQDDLCLTPRGY